MNLDFLEQLYITGDYLSLVEETSNLAYDDPISKMNDLDKAICYSYHSRALIRLGKVKDAENLIHKIINVNLSKNFSVSSLIYQTSIINLFNTQGNIVEALKTGLQVKALIEQNKKELEKQKTKLSYWSAFLYFLIGVSYYYQYKTELAYNHFQESLDITQTNVFIKAKCLYYMAFLEKDKGNANKYNELLERSLSIYHSIDDKQGIAWIFAWQGQIFSQKGDYIKAKIKLKQASDLFGSINDVQGSSLVTALFGLLSYHKGEIEKAEELLRKAFDSAIKVGNPVILSYCYLSIITLYIESGNRSKAQECIKKFQGINKSSGSEIVKLHGSFAEAIFLKSSSSFIDKGQAQQKLLKLLKDTYSEEYSKTFQILPTSDKNYSFFVIFHLTELYIEEFKISKEIEIIEKAQQLIENHLEHLKQNEFPSEVIELSLLKAKLLLIQGNIEKALVELEKAKQDAKSNSYARLEEKIGKEITQIDRDFKIWEAAHKTGSVKDRIEKVRLEEYIREAQRIIRIPE